MVRRKVYRTKRNPTTGAPTRYQVWTDIGESNRKRKPRRRRTNPLDAAWTTITTFLRSVSGTSRRRTTTRRRGWSTGDVHPNLYRRHATPPRSSGGTDEVARMRQRRRNRGKR